MYKQKQTRDLLGTGYVLETYKDVLEACRRWTKDVLETGDLEEYEYLQETEREEINNTENS